jgi:UDP-N-acetylmuramate dehydrogenase
MGYTKIVKLQTNRSLSEFSTFGIGGPIRLFVEVSTIEEMEEALSLGHPWLVVGKGSNCLFADVGFDGLVILNKIDFCEWQENSVFVGSGYSFSLLGVQSARKGLSGLEFASGIPATVGGAIFMNAGANGKETKDALKSVLYFDGKRQEFAREELSFSYRTSPFQKLPGVILGATFALTAEPAARQNQLKIVDYRMKTQPLKDKSVGCIFRNPPGDAAGRLIEQCGLKGTKIGGAKVSEVHANFIVNENKATSQDVRALIALIQKTVFEKTGVELESEVRFVPR